MSETDKERDPSVEDTENAAQTAKGEASPQAGSDAEPVDSSDAAPVETPGESAVEDAVETPDEPAIEEPADTPDEPAVEERTAAAAETPVEPATARPRQIVAWLALAVSTAALAAIAYTLVEDWRTREDTSLSDSVATLEQRQADARRQIDALDARVSGLAGQESVAPAEIDALRQEVDERVRLLDSLPARMTTLESSMASLAGISEGARDTFLLAEAEYYMQIANAQLQLANNPHLATLALEMADERIVQLANPALIDVRRAIADETAALAVMQKPDIAGTTLTLASLARVVDSLPLRSESPADDEAAEETDEEQSGVGRAWASVKGAMSGLIKVTPPDQAKLELLTPDAEYFLRNNIALQLQAARLALLRGEQAVFEQSLDDTTALLEQYFDTGSTQVSGALQTIGEIRGSTAAATPPDISGSLELLRQFQALRENSQ